MAARVPASYAPALLARREGPILAAAVTVLELVPDVLLVDATGLDHPRGAGLALHLGAVVGVPTVGVTHRPLVAAGTVPELRAGATAPIRIGGRCVGYWVCTRTAVRPVVAHAAWRTSPETAAHLVLVASTEAARTPVPLQEARRVAREARALAAAEPTSSGATGPVVPGDDQ
ncbi:MAG: endonuclease V [Actinomycetota bacterium]|nr:endonuclease V [Actinomycetota bacterium]